MKNILSLFIVGFLLVGFSEKDAKKTSWERDKLKGKVKSITETKYNAVEKLGKVQKDSLISKDIYKYDENGNKTEYAHYKSDDSLNFKYIYKYDESDNETEEAYYNSDGSLFWKGTNKYDEKGNEIEWAKYKSDGSLKSKDTWKHENDSKGNWTKKIEFEVKKEAFKTPRYITEREIEYYD